MGVKELFERLRGKTEDGSLNEYVKELDKRTRAEEIVSTRKLSSNERELSRIYKEFEDKRIKEELEHMRKVRQHDIEFGHNPLDTPNIMKKRKGDWEIMKERKLFVNEGNMFSNQKNIFVPKRRR